MLLSEVFNLPEKQWTPDGNHVYAELTAVGVYKSGQYGFKQPITLKDLGGNEIGITVQTKYEKGLCTSAMIEAKASWRLKWYSSKQGKQLVGYCLDKLSEGGQPAAQNAQQAPPQAAQSTQGTKDVDWDAKDLRMARMCGLNNATKMLCLFAETGKAEPPNIELITKIAELMVKYIYNGLSKQSSVKQAADDAAGEIGNHFDKSQVTNPDYVGDNPPPPKEDDVPF